MPTADPPGNLHSLTDHAMGALSRHEHGEGEFDHDHDQDFYLEPGSRSLESVPLVSIGVDIGSSSTQIAFSKLILCGPGEHRALRGRARDQQTLYLSPIAATPLRDDHTIDATQLRAIIDRAFAAAGLTPDDIECGAVILTGEAARRDNAETIAGVVAEEIGELVCAAAGHRMEALLAAHGSGAMAFSRQRSGQNVLLIDIGGATTKFVAIGDGQAIATAAMSAGGRLLTIDMANRIARLDPGARVFARRAGFNWRLQDVIDPAQRARLADLMCEAIVAVACGNDAPDLTELFLTAPLRDSPPPDFIMFSGGVAEYIYGRENRDFGDLGKALGLKLRAAIDSCAMPGALAPPGECIRATVLGASEYSVQLSGETIYISSHSALLPVRNLPVLRPAIDLTGDISAVEVADAIGRHRALLERQQANQTFALALGWRGAPDYTRARALCEGIAAGLADMIAASTPLYLIVEGDMALTLGALLRQDLHIASELLVIDGVVVRDFDYIDIGRLRLPSHTVPATIKSLLFGRNLQNAERSQTQQSPVIGSR